MDLKAFAISVSVVSEIGELIPLMIYLRCALNQQPYKILGYYFMLSAPIKLFTTITMLNHTYNLWVYHLLVIVEAVFLYSFYMRIIYNSKPRAWVIAVMVMVNALNTLFVESIDQFNSLAWTFSILFLLCL